MQESCQESTHETPVVSPECIISAIKHCSKSGFHDLVNLIKEVKMLEKHDEIIEAWDGAKKRHKEQDHGVTEYILAQKQIST